jgi:hypothetical protein
VAAAIWSYPAQRLHLRGTPLPQPAPNLVFTLVLGIVLGDNKKNKSPTLVNNTIPIKYALILKIQFFKFLRLEINYSCPDFRIALLSF